MLMKLTKFYSGSHVLHLESYPSHLIKYSGLPDTYFKILPILLFNTASIVYYLDSGLTLGIFLFRLIIHFDIYIRELILKNNFNHIN
jgi:hypothetical protein